MKSIHKTIVALFAVAASLFSVTAWADAPVVYVYCTNSSSGVNLWTWKSGDTGTHFYGSKWPGNPMNAVDGLLGWYKAVLDPAADGVYYLFIPNSSVQTSDLGPVTGNAMAWFDCNAQAATKGALFDASKYKVVGSWDGWKAESSVELDINKVAFKATMELEAGTYTFRIKEGTGYKTVSEAAARGNVYVEKEGVNEKFTISQKSNVFIYVDPGMNTVFVDAEKSQATEPTVLISKSVVVNNYDATLYGYVKYTGCEGINKNGFIYSTNRADLESATPTGTTISNTVSSMNAGDSFEKSGSFENGTYYYKSFIGDKDDNYYSEEIGSFTIVGECDITSPIIAIESASEVLKSGSASTVLSTETNAGYYNWVTVSKPATATVTLTKLSAKQETVVVDSKGDYVFKLQVKCNDGDAWTDSENTVTFHVCEAPVAQQLLLDDVTSNIICQGETSIATIVSQEGYDYTLKSSNAAEVYGTLSGNGSTLTWRNVSGVGIYNVVASESGTGLCESNMISATQAASPAKLVLTSSASSATYYKSVDIAVDEANSVINANPTWTITSGTNGYLLDPNTRLLYDSSIRRAAVDFKGGESSSTSDAYQITATATYTDGTLAKTCEAKAVVNVTVSPATDICD